MSITLVTGVPGSGKSLYAVWNLLRPMVGQTVKRQRDDGTTEELPRTVYTNVNGFQLEHELIEGGGKWVQGKDKEWEYEGNEHGFRNWHRWAKPGAFICFDEFQKMWPPRPNGAPIPPDVQTLDTHRHMGVDFVLICQNVNNIDRHVVGLIDRHLHVRRVANMPLATVYEWDHCSRSLMYRNAMAKSPFRYPKAAYKLYRSAEAHTKQSRKAPMILWAILASFAGLAYFVPTVSARITDRVTAKPATPALAAAADPQATTKTFVNEHGQQVTISTTTHTEAVAPDIAPPASSPALALAAGISAPEVSGCISVGPRCSCFTPQGKKLEMTADYCSENSASQVLVPKQVVPDTPAPRIATESDQEALAFLHRRP